MLGLHACHAPQPMIHNYVERAATAVHLPQQVHMLPMLCTLVILFSGLWRDSVYACNAKDSL